MLTHDEMIGLQAEMHELIDANNFQSKEQYVLHLIHSFAYVHVATIAKNKNVLDLGCNTGYGTAILFKAAKRVVGVDVSKEAIKTAKKNFGNLGIDFHVIDGKQLPFEDNEFEIIISFQVIEHIVDYNIYINELKRVLSPNGIVFFSTPNALLRLDPGMKPWNRLHVREFNHSQLEALLKVYFSTVKIMGLFAEESIYLIEKNRLSRARERARKRQQRRYYYQFRKILKNTIPSRITKILKNILVPFQQRKNGFKKSFIDRYGLKNFHYQTDEIDISLDLLAICTNADSVIQEIE